MISSQHIAHATLTLADKHPHDVEKVADNLLAFVKKYGLEMQLPAILKNIETEIAIRAKKETLLLQSPYTLDHGTLAQIKKFVGVSEHTKTEVTEHPELIGGFRAYWHDRKIDGSVMHTLETLREKLANDKA
jgi:F0F1-type ATP synthase delta subunit